MACNALLYLGWFYLVGAVIIAILLICWAFGKNYDYLEKQENSDNVDNENSFNNQATEVINNTQTMKINNDNLSDTLVKEKLSSEIQPQKKKCSNCGTENAIGNKRCFYCSNYFEVDDEK